MLLVFVLVVVLVLVLVPPFPFPCFCFWLYLSPRAFLCVASFNAFCRLLYGILGVYVYFCRRRLSLFLGPMKFLCLFTLTPLRYGHLCRRNGIVLNVLHRRHILSVSKNFPTELDFRVLQFCASFVNYQQIPCIKWDQKTKIDRRVAWETLENTVCERTCIPKRSIHINSTSIICTPRKTILYSFNKINQFIITCWGNPCL